MIMYQFEQWLANQKDVLDSIIANAGDKFWKANNVSNFGFDLNECQHESFNLIRKEDLCYDRPNTPLVYSLWYHARRVNTFLTHFCRYISEFSEKKIINIFDLGAGTGAVQWGIALMCAYLKQSGGKCPVVRVVNVDISPLMLKYNRDYLWPNFCQEYPYVDSFSVEYECNSWSNVLNEYSGEVWISASYLFDISDIENNEDGYFSSIRDGFLGIVRRFEPSRIILLTSNQSEKVALMTKIVDQLPKNIFKKSTFDAEKLIFKGGLNKTSELRRKLFDAYSTELNGAPGWALRNACSWHDVSFVSCSIVRIEQKIFGLDVKTDNPDHEIHLFNAPIKFRKEVILNLEQQKASTHEKRFTVITGPAGCGKSVVITERIKNLVENQKYDKNLSIIVTTFNKELTKLLAAWTKELLDSKKCIMAFNKGFAIYFSGSTQPNIVFMHFDVLPTRFGGIKGNLIFDVDLRVIAQSAITHVITERKIPIQKYNSIINPDYVIEEYHRIIYGLQYVKEEDYLQCERKGRNPRLRVGGNARKILWEICMKFLALIPGSNESDSIITRRHKFLKMLRSGKCLVRFDYVFVDEFQDCTQADFEIFDKLCKSPDQIILAGDVAQAVHIGKVADIPRLHSQEAMGNRRFIRLMGSYRLPYRISEAIMPISKHFHTDTVVSPYKAAPPGARPIVVYADSQFSIMEKMRKIYDSYRDFDIDHATVLQKDQQLVSAMLLAGIPCTHDTILKLKGLEKPFVIWSTRIDIEHRGDLHEFVYTILSRTSSILVIVLSPQTLPMYFSVLKMFVSNRIIFWDKISKDKYLEYRELGNTALVEEDIE